GVTAHEVTEVIISSVVPLALSRLIYYLNKTPGRIIRITGKDVDVPIKNLYKVKSEVGQDRLVNAFAANKLYGAPCVIVDFGTAITFDIVSGKGEYLGGLILPGIKMSLKSLYDRTALLPKVELKAVSNIIGKDTINSMRGGILFGFGAMCDGLVSQYRKILGKGAKVIATGGNAGLVKRYAKSINIVDEDLTLRGLFLIYKSLARCA
ncbi:MAG: type III pantothenate kinase, partial [Candidatus Omnitrophica bacterium]|nr:type III pantothenate kinase [Candidatus Omnitrophota bacterium]